MDGILRTETAHTVGNLSVCLMCRPITMRFHVVKMHNNVSLLLIETNRTVCGLPLCDFPTYVWKLISRPQQEQKHGKQTKEPKKLSQANGGIRNFKPHLVLGL